MIFPTANGELVHNHTPRPSVSRDVALRTLLLGDEQTKFFASKIAFSAFVVALPSTFGRADGISTSRTAALHECKATALKRWSGKYDFVRNRRAAYTTCMLSHG